MEGTYSPPASRRNQQLQLISTIGKDDRIIRSSGLVATVTDPETVTSILETRGFVRQQRRGYEVASHAACWRYEMMRFMASGCAKLVVSYYNTNTIKQFDAAMLVASGAVIEPEQEVR